MKKELISIAVVVGVLGLTYFQHNKIQRLKSELSTSKKNLKLAIGEANVLDREKKALQLDIEDLNELIAYDSVVQAHLQKENDIKTKNIKSLTKLINELKGEVSAPIITEVVRVDTFTLDTLKRFGYDDGYLSISGIVLPDKVDLKYAHNDTISLVIHQKKYKKFFVARWFEKPTTTATVVNCSPYNNFYIDKVVLTNK